MKNKSNYKKFFPNISGIKFIKKYNYNINEVIGVKGKDKYILYVEKKLIRIYRDKLKSTSLLSTYIPIENAIFYNFKIEKSVLEKVDIKSLVETKVYDEAGIDETEEYIIKYKIIDFLSDNKYIMIETVIVPETFMKEHYKDILNEAGYIDYISFPAFSYKALYEEKILQKANDLFIVLLFDKVFLTFYSGGELIYIQTLSGGLDKIHESLSGLNIKDYDTELLKMLLTKKGLSIGKYSSKELVVLESMKQQFSNFSKIVSEQIQNLSEIYDINNIERIFITTEYGDVPELDEIYESELGVECRNFEFYEKYNLDRLPVDPFLFLGMLETHYAYKQNNQEYNFSLFLRKPTFLYRPSGKIVLITLIALILGGLYPFYLWITGFSLEQKNAKLTSEISKMQTQINGLNKTIATLTSKEKKLKKEIFQNQKQIDRVQNFISSVYKFKFSYLAKSQELVDITRLMNKDKVYAKNIVYKNGLYTIKLFSYKESNIPTLIKDLSDNGFSVNFDKITYKDGKYNSIIRIKE